MKTLMLDLWYLGHFLAAEVAGRLPGRLLRPAAIDGLAGLSWRLSRDKRRRVERHVELAFGAALSNRDKRAITRACFRDFWQEMVDWVPGAISGTSPEDIPVHGLEHLQRALADGRGAILWESNGFGRRVRGKRALHAHGVRLYQTHGETHLGVMDTPPGPGTWIRQRLLRGTYERRERAFVAEIVHIPLDPTVASGRAYLKHLRTNRVLCMAGDGQIARKRYAVNLLGRSVELAPGAVKLAWLSGAPLLPVFWVPEDGEGPALEIGPPIRPEGEGDAAVVACLQAFASALDKHVRRWPRAYRTWHLLGETAAGEVRAE